MSHLFYYTLFPYLNGAQTLFRKILKEKELRLSELFDEETAQGVFERLTSGIGEWKITREGFLPLTFHPRNKGYGINYLNRRGGVEVFLREFLTYFGSIVILAEVGDRWARKRYSIFESKRFGAIMGIFEEMEDDEISSIGKELGMKVEIEREVRQVPIGRQEVTVERNIYLVPFCSFLKASPTRVGKWKMINHVVHKGMVWIYDKRELFRLMQHFVSRKIEEEIEDLMERKRGKIVLPETLTSVVERIKRQIEAYKAKINEISSGEEADFPPCMKAIVAQIRSGSNVSHQGRFAITTFLHKIGWSEERILDLMRNLPDFDERVAAYQVRHILGEISRKEYEVPSCDTMRTYGLCVPDELCKKVKHPLQYLRKKAFLRRRRGIE